MTAAGFKTAPPGTIDSHCHVASLDYIPPSFIEGSIDNAVLALTARGMAVERNKIRDVCLSQLCDPDCDRLIREMDEAGIGKAVLLLPDFTYALKDCRLTIAEMYEQHGILLKRWPERFYVFAGVDPRWGADGLALFEKGVLEYGFNGMKVYPPCGFAASDRELYPYYEICAARSLPVTVHVGGTSPVLGFETAGPLLLDRAARDFPHLPFILAHGSVAYVDECLMLCRFRSNVYMDISAYSSAPISCLSRVFGTGVDYKILFGTDWPVFRVQGNLKTSVEFLLQRGSPVARLRDRERANFFGNTIAGLIGAGVGATKA